MIRANIRHTAKSLEITIPTDTPAVFHQLLLSGINDAVQYYISHPDKKPATDGLMALMKLQQIILPTEMELEKAFD